MLAYIKIIRPINLLIVAVLFLLIRFVVLAIPYEQHGVAYNLSTIEFSLFLFAAISITAAGYIINDYYDRDIDAVNKPSKVYIGQDITPRQALIYYFLFSIVGILASCYVGYSIGQFSWVAFFPISTLGLWWYAARLKQSFFWGNFIVSFFSSIVIWMIILSEYSAIQALPFNISSRLLYTLGLYSVFAFFSSMFRELVKDLEDKVGDKVAGADTMAIRLPKSTLNYIVLSYMGGIICAVVTALCAMTPVVFMYVASLPILFGAAYLLYSFLQANTKQDYKVLSNLTKYYMLVGLLVLLLIGFI